MSMFDEVDVTAPINITLAEKYQVSPTVIGYIRAALMRQDNTYECASLMYHIIEENTERKKEIKKLQLGINEENIEAIKAQIVAIQKKMDFRQGVLAILRNIDEKHLRDILQPVDSTQ